MPRESKDSENLREVTSALLEEAPIPAHILRLRNELTPKQLHFCEALLDGKTPRQAALDASPDTSPTTASSNAYYWKNHPPVRAYLDAVHAVMWNEGHLSRAEKRHWLARVARTPACEIFTENGEIREGYGDLVNKVTKRTNFDKEGNVSSESFTVELYSAMEAIRVDNQMAGHDMPSDDGPSGDELDMSKLMSHGPFRESLLKELERTSTPQDPSPTAS